MSTQPFWTHSKVVARNVVEASDLLSRLAELAPEDRILAERSLLMSRLGYTAKQANEHILMCARFKP